jgi:hypothetical protein
MNPSYYGAASSSVEDLEEFYLEVIKTTMTQLKDEGCITVDETEGTDSLIAPTSLGRACSNFYLLHNTPIQMKNGANELKKALSRHASDDKKGHDMPIQSFLNKDMTKRVKSIQSFVLDQPIYLYAVAKILFELASTHGVFNFILSFLIPNWVY